MNIKSLFLFFSTLAIVLFASFALEVTRNEAEAASLSITCASSTSSSVSVRYSYSSSDSVTLHVDGTRRATFSPGSQSNRTYTARFLSPGKSYTVTLRSGNTTRSATCRTDSVSAPTTSTTPTTTTAPRTTTPSLSISCASSTSSSVSVRYSYSSSDSVTLHVDGTRRATFSPGSQSNRTYTARFLSPGKSYTVTLRSGSTTKSATCRTNAVSKSTTTRTTSPTTTRTTSPTTTTTTRVSRPTSNYTYTPIKTTPRKTVERTVPSYTYSPPVYSTTTRPQKETLSPKGSLDCYSENENSITLTYNLEDATNASIFRGTSRVKVIGSGDKEGTFTKEGLSPGRSYTFTLRNGPYSYSDELSRAICRTPHSIYEQEEEIEKAEEIDEVEVKTASPATKAPTGVSGGVASYALLPLPVITALFTLFRKNLRESMKKVSRDISEIKEDII